MATLKPFRGLRYDPVKVGDLSTVVAPPYDVIDGAAQAALYDRSPYNAVRLILNRDADAYASAAATLAAWRASRVLIPEPTPTLYLYALRFQLADGGEHERFGVIGALHLERFDSGRVRPHERTLDKAKSDRLALIRACRASLSPIFGLVAVPGWHFGLLAPSSVPDIDIRDDTGARHRVWRLDAATVAVVAQRLADGEVFIADGHHRYETALAYRDERRAALGASAPPPGSAPYDYVLAYLTTMDDPGLVILPTHRVLHTLAFTPAELRVALARHFQIEELPWTRQGMAALLGRLQEAAVEHGGAQAARTARQAGGAMRSLVRIGAAVAGAGALWLLTARAAELPYPSDLALDLRTLDVSALHQIVLRRILDLPIGERGGTPGLSYTQDARAAFARVENGEAAAVFFLPATDVEDLRAVSMAGLTMPEKSTYFHPKLLTGLVIYPLAEIDEPAGGAEQRTGTVGDTPV